MKYLRYTRITKTKTFPKVGLEVMFDYTHFLYKHKSSFKDFRVISDKNNEQIFYYETRVFNWFLWSPIRRLISIKRLFPRKKMFNQIYFDLNSKNVFFFQCSMKNNQNNIEIINDLSIPVSNLFYFFRKPLLWMLNKKLDIMWHEDKEMMSQLYDKQDHENVQCFAKSYNLENIFDKEFEKHFNKEKNIDYFVSL